MDDDDTDANVYRLRQPEDLMEAYRRMPRPEIDDVISKVKTAMEAADLLERAEGRAAEWLPGCGPMPPRVEVVWMAGIMLKEALKSLEEAKTAKPGKVLRLTPA